MVRKKDNQLHIEADHSVSVVVDLEKHNLSAEQLQILEKATKALHGASRATFTDSGCPSKPHLTPEEFQKISSLKATIGSTRGAEEDSIIVDFCLHAVNV